MNYIIEVYTKDTRELGFIIPFVLDEKIATDVCKTLNNSWPNLECIVRVKE